MGGIVISIILIIACVITAIILLKAKEFGSVLLCIAFLGLSVWLLFDSINSYKYGLYEDLVTKYGMVHDGTDYIGTYTKDTLYFYHHSLDTDFVDTYKITDVGSDNLNIHAYILNLFFNFSEGTVQMIYQHLTDYGNHLETSSEITIYDNHMKLYIEYYPQSNTIEYQITRVKPHRKIKEKDLNNEEREVLEDNPDYEKTYAVSELRINHYNDDYLEFDKKLGFLIFNKDITDTNVIDNNYSGIHRLSYCLGASCRNNSIYGKI